MTPWLAGGSFGLDRLPPIDFPVIGSKWMLGALFLAHILFGSFSMGAVLISPTAELIGRVRGSGRLLRYAHGVALTNLKVFSVGATLGSFAVFMLTGLYPSLFVSLGVLFFKTLLIAFLSWFVIIALLLLYAYKWDAVVERMGAGFHVALGYAGGLTEQLFLFLIVGVDSFLLTPNQAQDFGAIFNASFWEELFHRFVGNVSWTSLLIAAVMIGYWAGARDPEERGYYAWAARVSLALGFVLLVPQAIGGFLFAESIRHASPGAFSYSFTGPMAWMWQVQQALLGVVLVGGNVALWQSRDGRALPSAVLTAVVALLSIGTVLPAAAYPGPAFWLRYVWLALALLLSLAHWLLWNPLRRAPRPDLRRMGRVAVATTGVVAVALFLLMGVIRETARGPYAIYGSMTQRQGQQLFQAPNGRFFP